MRPVCLKRQWVRGCVASKRWGWRSHTKQGLVCRPWRRVWILLIKSVVETAEGPSFWKWNDSIYILNTLYLDRSYWNVSFLIHFCTFSWMTALSRLWFFQFHFLLSTAFLEYLELGLGWLLFIQEATECSWNLHGLCNLTRTWILIWSLFAIWP